jgi:alpha,alpha-trehalose phosphorylase
VAASDDKQFERGPGLEVLVETARLWHSLGHHDAEGRFRINRATGPDEYTALVDNNVFTNLMAARNLQAAAKVATRHPHRAAEQGFTRYRPWDFATTTADEYPLLLHYPYYLLYSSHVVKQADPGWEHHRRPAPGIVGRHLASLGGRFRRPA